MMRFPWTQRPLFWLSQYRIPVVFDLLFGMHFAYYASLAERVSFVQFIYHVKVMMLNPFLRGKQPLQSTGRPFDIPWRRPAMARGHSEAAAR